MLEGSFAALELRRIPGLALDAPAEDFSIAYRPHDTAAQIDQLQAWRGGRQVGLLGLEWLAGGNVWLWGPETNEGEQEADRIARFLLDAANREIDRREVRVAQVLLDLKQHREAGWFAACGYDCTIRLEFLVCVIAPRAAVAAPLPSGICEMVPYDEENREAFAQTLMDSAEESLDCVALGRWGETENVLADFQGVGAAERDLWMLLRVAGEDVGCLLLRHHRDTTSLEIIYLGVIPSFRRRSLGREAVSFALDQANRLGCRQVTVAVDLQNMPARALYGSFDFVTFGEKQAMMRGVPPLCG